MNLIKYHGLDEIDAKRALRAVCRHYKRYKRDGHRMPQTELNPDDAIWQIWWDDGPLEWATRAADDGLVLPKPYMYDPYDDQTINIYHAEVL